MLTITRRGFFRAVLTATALALEGGTAYGDTGLKEISVKLRRFEIDPEVIKVRQGDRVRLHVEGVDIQHGFYIDGYDIGVEVGHIETKPIEFVADKVGAFKTRCTVTCGSTHPFMVGKFVVEPNNRFGFSVLAAFGLPLLAAAYYYFREGKE